MAMNQVIKKEWMRRIKNSPKGRPYHILNKMYEESTGKVLKDVNKYRLRDGARVAPKMIGLTEWDMIHPDTKDWAELEHQMPQLPSYHEMGGIGLNKATNTVGVIWEHGSFVKNGIVVKAAEESDLFIELINKDL